MLTGPFADIRLEAAGARNQQREFFMSNADTIQRTKELQYSLALDQPPCIENNGSTQAEFGSDRIPIWLQPMHRRSKLNRVNAGHAFIDGFARRTVVHEQRGRICAVRPVPVCATN